MVMDRGVFQDVIGLFDITQYLTMLLVFPSSHHTIIRVSERFPCSQDRNRTCIVTSFIHVRLGGLLNS
jgi:hypothetical protein